MIAIVFAILAARKLSTVPQSSPTAVQPLTLLLMPEKSLIGLRILSEMPSFSAGDILKRGQFQLEQIKRGSAGTFPLFRCQL